MSRYTRAFTATALLALLVAAVLHLLVAAQFFRLWQPMVHLAFFGWITGMIVAVNYHTLPVFSGRDFASTGVIWAHWVAFTGGISLATLGLVLHVPRLEVSGLLLQFAAAILFVVSTCLLLFRGKRHARRPPVPPIPDQKQVDRVGTRATAGAGLALPVALGLQVGVHTGSIGNSWLLAAEHLVALGWVMLMIVGVAYHVLPRFSGQGTRGARWARSQFVCHLSAVLFIVVGLGFGIPMLFALGGAMMALAVALFAWTIWPTLRAIGSRAPAPTHFVAKEHTR